MNKFGVFSICYELILPTICTPPQFLAIHNSHWDSCVNTVGDTILMWVKPWFSSEAGKDFLKRENGGVFYYIIFGKEVIDVY